MSHNFILFFNLFCYEASLIKLVFCISVVQKVHYYYYYVFAHNVKQDYRKIFFFKTCKFKKTSS